MADTILAERDAMDPAEATRLSDWLAANGPDQWHDLVCHWNYDFGLHPIAWIVQQPDCDRATAHRVFFDLSDWLLLWDSARQAGRPTPANDELRILDYVIARWRAGQFPRSELGSEVRLHEWGLANLKAVPYGVPDSMFDPLAGRTVEPVPWGEAMPAGVETPR